MQEKCAASYLLNEGKEHTKIVLIFISCPTMSRTEETGLNRLWCWDSLGPNDWLTVVVATWWPFRLGGTGLPQGYREPTRPECPRPSSGREDVARYPFSDLRLALGIGHCWRGRWVTWSGRLSVKTKWAEASGAELLIRQHLKHSHVQG